MDLIWVGQGQFWLVVAELLRSGDAELVQGGLQLLKIQSLITDGEEYELLLALFVYTICCDMSDYKVKGELTQTFSSLRKQILTDGSSQWPE